MLAKLTPPLVVLAIVILGMSMDYQSAVTVAQVDAEAAARPKERNIPMYHPLDCPTEDDAGQSLRVSMYFSGERRPRCYYGATQ